MSSGGSRSPPRLLGWIAEALRESQDDKERFHRAAVLRLQQQYIGVQAKIDRAYEDRLAGRVSDDLWQRKSKEWEQELANYSPRDGPARVGEP